MSNDITLEECHTCPKCGEPYDRFVEDDEKLNGDAEPIPDDARTCRKLGYGDYVHSR